MTATSHPTPLAAQHRALGARMVPFAGWEMPLQYSGIIAEHMAVRKHAGLFDVSHMGEILITGESAVELLDRLVTNTIERSAVGQATYTLLCHEHGGVMDDLIVYRLSERELLVICNASNRERVASWLLERAHGPNVDVVDETDRWGLLALQGPKAESILQKAAPNLPSLKRFRFGRAVLAGVECTIARTGYTGEDGFELLIPAEHVGAAWSLLLAVGTSDGLVPVGLGARDTLRLEACLPLYGHELDDTTSPLEAGLGWAVKLDKHDFVGRAALLKQKDQGLSRQLVGIEVLDKGSARAGYQLFSLEEQPLGVCTSGGPAPYLDKSVALGYVPVSSSDVGTELLVSSRGKLLRARIVDKPFYRGAGLRRAVSA